MGYTVTKMTVNKAVLILENRIKCHKQEKEEAKQMAIKALRLMDKHCGNCKYCGEVLKDNLHSCNNNKSIFKACLETATGCEKFEP